MNEPDSMEDLSLLLAGQVLGDLDAGEQVELRSMLDRADSDSKWRTEREELALAAATLELISESSEEAVMPDDLREKIREQSRSFVSDRRTDNLQVHSDGGPASADQASLSKHDSWNKRELFAWLACAASLLVVVSLVGSRGFQTGREVSLEDQRLALLTDAQDILQVDWSVGTTPLPDEVSGDVIWSNDEQKGFMRFVGLPVNDPTVEQYQLWIIDPDRDEEPIDGGVFDIQQGEESIVAIDAKLKVVNPAAFAITIEKPGGVVVSTQERLPLLASVR